MKKKSTALYPHPFSSAYWKDAAAECKSIRSLSYAAFLCAVAIVVEKFNIPLTPALHVSVSFFAIALCSMLTGPVLAVGCGLLVDLIGMMGSPYPFFPGYTLTAILTAVVYALFLYRSKVTYLRVLLCEILINFAINTFLGSLWRTVLYDGFFPAYVLTSGAKNLLLLLPEAFLLCLFLQALHRPLIHLGALPPQTEIRFRKRSSLVSLVVTIVGTCIAALLYFL